MPKRTDSIKNKAQEKEARRQLLVRPTNQSRLGDLDDSAMGPSSLESAVRRITSVPRRPSLTNRQERGIDGPSAPRDAITAASEPSRSRPPSARSSSELYEVRPSQEGSEAQSSKNDTGKGKGRDTMPSDGPASTPSPHIRVGSEATLNDAYSTPNDHSRHQSQKTLVNEPVTVTGSVFHALSYGDLERTGGEHTAMRDFAFPGSSASASVPVASTQRQYTSMIPAESTEAAVNESLVNEPPASEPSATEPCTTKAATAEASTDQPWSQPQTITAPTTRQSP